MYRLNFVFKFGISLNAEDPLLTADETLNNGAVNVTDMLLEGIGN